MLKPTPPPNQFRRDPDPLPWPVIFAATVALASLLISRDACAEVITDPALVCAAARTGDGAWFDTAGLRECLASERLRGIDAREIMLLRKALQRESEARAAAQAELLRDGRWRWYFLTGGVTIGVIVAVVIMGAAS